MRAPFMLSLILPLMIIPLSSVADPVPTFGTLPLRAAPASLSYSEEKARFGELEADEIRALPGQDDPGLRMALARVLDRGATPEDDAAAFALFHALALEGYFDAQYDVGRQMSFGRGTDRDQPGALLWYRQALRGGHVTTAAIWASKFDTTAAMLNPDGTLLQPDIAFAADDVVSLMWHLVAFEMGQHPSTRDILLGRYEAELSTQDYARAEAMAQSCVESAFVDCSWPRR